MVASFAAGLTLYSATSGFRLPIQRTTVTEEQISAFLDLGYGGGE